MAKTKISEFSSTPANNTDIDSINIAEGCAPSGINDAIRELMSQLKDFQTGAQGDSFNGPIGSTTASTGAFTTLTTTGTINNLTVGRGAGAVSSNTAVGASALATNSIGAEITAVGYEALKLATASESTAVGYRALASASSGTRNVGVGRLAGFSTTTGGSSVSIGTGSHYSNTTGNNNVAIGDLSLFSNTTASSNTAVGYQSLYANTTGSGVDAFGASALKANTTGTLNAAFGQASLTANTTGTNNLGAGFASLLSNTTGGANTALGVYALQANTTASNNTVVGYQAGYNTTTAGVNAFFGNTAGYSNTTGAGNTFIGQNAGYSNTTGTQNTFVGHNTDGTAAGYYVTTGSKNAILGGYNGNQGGLDIRTSSNNIVLSDGDGNPRAVWNSSGRATTLVWQADAAYSNNYTYSSGWATTFQTLLPGGTFSITSTYLVTINLELDGAPYYCDCSFLWKPVSTNGGAGTSLAFIPGPTATHVGSGEYWTVRSTCPSSSNSGLQAQLTGGNTGLSGVVRVKVALIAGY